MKKILLFLILFFIFIVGTEILLRQYFGFCDAVLMQEDPDFEYIAQPNQKRFRFRNHIYYNSKSMRSEEIDTSAVIMLGFGDSVLNGGAKTDQDSLATTILSDTLSVLYGKKVQFLNISAGSWGPDNCFAYLKKYGDFGAKGIFLFVNSQDTYDTMTFVKTVDVSRFYPSKQYKLAIFELIDRYLIPEIRKHSGKRKINRNNSELNKAREDAAINSGFQSFLSYTTKKNIPFTIYLHADKKEMEMNSYNEKGKKIIEFAEINNIRLIKDLQKGIDASEYIDEVHINEKGQRKLAIRVLNEIKFNEVVDPDKELFDKTLKTR